jgi:hypothetical protein
VFNPHAAASTLPTAFPDRSRGGSEHPPAAGSDPPVNPHGAACRLPKPLGFARTGEARVLGK